jgi:hypothetical protein
MCLYVQSSVLWCPLHFQHTNYVRFVLTTSCLLEESYLVCWTDHILFVGGIISCLLEGSYLVCWSYLVCVICVCLCVVVSNTYCVCYCFVILRIVYLMLSVSLDYPFLIVPSVFYNVYLSVSLDYPFLIVPSVFHNVYLSVFLDYPFFNAPSVFYNVYYIYLKLNSLITLSIQLDLILYIVQTNV